MWFRVRTAAFLATALAVFVAVGVTLGWLLAGYAAALSVREPATAALHRVVVAIAVAGVGLAALLLVQIAAHAVSTRAVRFEADALARWGERWARAAEGGPVPEAPLGPFAADALALLRESVRGSSAEAFERLYARSGLLRADVEAAASGRGLRRVQAIERLAMMRHPACVEPLVRLAADRDRVVSRLARRAAVRTLAGGRLPGEALTLAGLRLLHDPRVGSGEATELLLLLDRTATPLLAELLRPTPYRPSHLRVAAIEAIGRAGRVDLAGRLSLWIRDRHPELRAAALRAFRSLEHVPDEEHAAVLQALVDPVGFVRTQAAGACLALPWQAVHRPLWRALGDPDRWVRRTAAASLAGFGGPGREALREAARHHEDRFGRDAAAEALAWS